jgi:hypothetical protein
MMSTIIGCQAEQKTLQNIMHSKTAEFVVSIWPETNWKNLFNNTNSF